VIVAVALAALALGACGRDDFENDPRPAVPTEVSVEINDDAITVSPSQFGAGLVNFTIVNLADTATTVAIHGPTDLETEDIDPGTNTIVKTEVKTGDYEASADSTQALPFQFSVGADNPSGQDDLLLP
jgi:hypothetical protein